MMTLQIPNTIVSELQQRGLAGDPDEWQFKAVRLSNDRAYLWFTTNDGFTVHGTDWQPACMADAVAHNADNAALSVSLIPLKILKKATGDISVYPDGSIAWEVKNARHTASWRDNRAAAQVRKWQELVLKDSTHWWIRLTGRATHYQKIAQSLEKLAMKITKT